MEKLLTSISASSSSSSSVTDELIATPKLLITDMDFRERSKEDNSSTELPPCEVEKLPELLVLLKTAFSTTVRSKIVRDLLADNGAYIAKLLRVFDLAEEMQEEGDDADDKQVLHQIFNIFYAMMELCDRKLIEMLLNDANFLSVVGVFGHNPGLIKEIDFRSTLETNMRFKEVVPIKEPSVVERVHLNYRIHVIKDNVLSRSLPDCTVILLEHIVNENSYHILMYILESDDYVPKLKQVLQQNESVHDGLGLLKEIIHLVSTTRPLDKLQQSRGMQVASVFTPLINIIFAEGVVFESFARVLGSNDSRIEDISMVVEILIALMNYHGPERLRHYLSSEALIYAFEQYEPTRFQLFTLFKEVFQVNTNQASGMNNQDNRFLEVLYPNYIQWLVQPFKYAPLDDGDPVFFSLQDRIMELLTIITECHGYRVKYFFGRQPIAEFVRKMLESKNKLFVIHAVKFMRACAARAESFFSRFLTSNALFTPVMMQLRTGGKRSCAVSSAILELLSFIEKTKLRMLIEHIYNKFFESHRNECPMVFDALKARFHEIFETENEAELVAEGVVGPAPARSLPDVTTFMKQNVVDEEDRLYWDRKDDSTTLDESSLSENEITCRSPDTESSVPMVLPKLVDYKDDEESEPSKAADSKADQNSSAADQPEEPELKLPERKRMDDEEDSKLFLHGLSKLPHKKSRSSPQYKSIFNNISWKTDASSPRENLSLSPLNLKKKNPSSPPTTPAPPPINSENHQVLGEIGTKLHQQQPASSTTEVVPSQDKATILSSTSTLKRERIDPEAVSTAVSLVTKKAKSCEPIGST